TSVSAKMVCIRLRFKESSCKTDAETALFEITDRDCHIDGLGRIKRQKLLVRIEKARRRMIVPVAHRYGRLGIAARKMYPLECLVWRHGRIGHAICAGKIKKILEWFANPIGAGVFECEGGERCRG